MPVKAQAGPTFNVSGRLIAFNNCAPTPERTRRNQNWSFPHFFSRIVHMYPRNRRSKIKGTKPTERNKGIINR